jgi:hypothetical protein
VSFHTPKCDGSASNCAAKKMYTPPSGPRPARQNYTSHKQ